MHTNMAEFRNKQSLSSVVIALRTQRTPRDSMTVLFLGILILASLRPFCFLDEVADFSPPSKQFSTNSGALLVRSSCCGMFSFVPERTGRITQSQIRMNCVQVGEGEKKNIYEQCSSKKGNKIRLKPILLSQLFQLSAGYRLILKLNILTLELSLII